MKKVALSIISILFISSLAISTKAQAIVNEKGPSDPSPGLFANLDGSRVHYRNYGKGDEAIVFVHGWTCNMSFWGGQWYVFERLKRTILIDLPGHGMSDKPQINYSMDLFARAIKAVLDDAKVKRAVLVGHSMGTPVIRQFYRKYPKETVALVIVDGGLRPFADKKMMDAFIAPLRAPNYQEAAGKFVDAMLAPVSSPKLREEIKRSMLATPQHVAVSAMDAMADPAVWGEDKINVPVLAVLAKSPFWPADNETFYRSLAPDMDYQMWDGVSHFLMMEKPDEFNRSLATFLVRIKFIKEVKR
ncbi:MAG TPA: alpha/beta hydrolase [Blastocatellia bacterium]|jgi:pimeloyl-ACP methyl ester carboxylesterase